MFCSRLIPAAWLLACLPIHALTAQEAAPTPTPAPAKEIPPVLVTATRLPEAKEAVGSPVTLISGDDIRQSQARSLSDALQLTPGLTVMRNGDIGQGTALYLRGTNPSHTLVLMDGVRVMDPSTGDGRAAIDQLMANDLAQVEVLPGAQSPLYGSDAIGGVIATTTTKGAGPTSATASVEGGSRNTWTERVQAGGGDDTFNWHVGALRTDSRGYSASNDGENDPYRNTSLAVRLGWEITDVFGIDLIARGAHAHSAFDDAFSGAQPATDTDLGFFKLAPHLVLADGKWEQVLNLSAFATARENNAPGAGAFSGYPSKFNGHTLQADWQNTLHVSPQLDLVGGLAWLREDAKGTESANFSADAQTCAAYAQARWNPVERVTLNGGARVDDHSAFGDHTTWRTAIAYDSVETNTILRASCGTGFRAPSLVELYDNTVYFGSTYNNPALRPEESLGWDAGFDQRFLGEGKDAKGVFSVTYFHNNLSNLIQGAAPTFQNMNVAKAVTRGVETALRVTLFDGANAGKLTATGSYTYTHAENTTTGARLLRRPLHQAALRVDYTLPHEAASIGVAGRYLGVRSDLDPVTFASVQADDKLVWDVVARVKITNQVSAFGRLENLFDNGTPDVLGFNPTPFGAFAGVEVKF